MGQLPALEDCFYEMLQKAQGRDPSLFLPVTPVPPTPGWCMAATPGMANGAEAEDDQSLAELFGLEAKENSPPAPKHRVMLYRPSVHRSHAVLAIRQLDPPKSQIGQARVVDGLSLERAMEIAQKFVAYLAEGAVQETDVAELLADSFSWVASDQ